MTPEEQKFYDIINVRVEEQMKKVRMNPLFQDWSAASFRDNLLFGKETSETEDLKKKMIESFKQNT